jgi:hypothetical protein
MSHGKPRRPDFIELSCLRDLYLHFERLFLCDHVSGTVESCCGHEIKVFDHHFFHFVKLDHPKKPKPLLMAHEKSEILSTRAGFGGYTYDRQRAIYLASARMCLEFPDEVWLDEKLTTAKWIYLKEFDARPYSFTILLIAERSEGLVPVTSFPGKKRDARKWRRGMRIHPENAA